MSFVSDNTAGIAPSILAALEAVNSGLAPAYGADHVTAGLEARFAEIFEHEVRVFPVATGTAANALMLACLSPRYGAIYCHEDAHIHTDECAAPEFFTGGAKLVPCTGASAKIDPADLERRLQAFLIRAIHSPQNAALSVTQATELGTSYTPDELGALGEIAARHGLGYHMDGARFANSLVHLGCAPADLTWRAGLDALSFGATKNGTMGAEAAVFFDAGKAAEFEYLRKRAGHLQSKMRFLSVQLEAYLADDLWLANARRANAMAARLADGLAPIGGIRLAEPREANEVFAVMPEAMIQALAADGLGFARWGGPGSTTLRLVTNFGTTEGEVDAFVAAAAQLAA